MSKSDLTASPHYFKITLTGGGNWRSREQYLIDSFPRHRPGFRYQTHLVLIYPFLSLGLSSFASFLGICMKIHFSLVIHDKPATRAINWCAVVSPEMLPRFNSTTCPNKFRADVEDQLTSTAISWKIQDPHMIDILCLCHCWGSTFVGCTYGSSMQASVLGHRLQTSAQWVSFYSRPFHPEGQSLDPALVVCPFL